MSFSTFNTFNSFIKKSTSVPISKKLGLWGNKYTNLFSYYKFDETTGTFIDSIGGFNAVVQNTIGYNGIGKVDKCATLTGAGYCLISGNSYNLFSGNNGGTITAWVKISTIGSHGIICKQCDGTGTFGALGIGCNINGGGTANTSATADLSKVCFHLQNNGPGNGYIQSNSNIALNTWTFISVSWDGSNVRMYLNGVLDNTYASSGNMATTSTQTNCTIGAFLMSGSLKYQFNGSLDEIALYNTCLTAADILQIYNYQV